MCVWFWFVFFGVKTTKKNAVFFCILYVCRVLWSLFFLVPDYHIVYRKREKGMLIQYGFIVVFWFSTMFFLS